MRLKRQSCSNIGFALTRLRTRHRVCRILWPFGYKRCIQSLYHHPDDFIFVLCYLHCGGLFEATVTHFVEKRVMEVAESFAYILSIVRDLVPEKIDSLLGAEDALVHNCSTFITMNSSSVTNFFMNRGLLCLMQSSSSSFLCCWHKDAVHGIYGLSSNHST